ncbi:MAG: tRNA epoxyqueuosine(34) reductase QueG [Firmicutes bacterium]|nr:tRNA epoxyqueuosine(34) reductase QueG [Bacillota bacterium]
MPNLAKIIKKEAINIGFDLVGITSAEPFRDTAKRLNNRKLSSFIKNDIELLTKPRLHLPSARSIIAVALSYASSQKYNGDCYISIYARGRDYHHVMKNKLEKLMGFIREIVPGVDMLAYSDTGPLLDRMIASRAGLGWIGKNNNLINPVYGSYLFLGEILTNLELEHNQPLNNQCCNCNLCIKNCPSSALMEAYHLRADRCISYLTQKKGIIPEEEREVINSHLWGCDNCQDFCPYNKNVPTDLHEEFTPLLKAELSEILRIDNLAERDLWTNSALYWRGPRILKRNAIINIANNRDRCYLSDLIQKIDDPSPIIRFYTAWAVGKIASKEYIKTLNNRLLEEKDKDVRNELKKAINRIKRRI